MPSVKDKKTKPAAKENGKSTKPAAKAPAKKEVPPAKKTKSGSVVTVKDLESEFGMAGVKIRQVIRGLGLRAPATEQQGGFGPRAKYEWDANSKDLAKIKKALSEASSPAEDEEEPEEDDTETAEDEGDEEGEGDDDEDEDDE